MWGKTHRCKEKSNEKREYDFEPEKSMNTYISKSNQCISYIKNMNKPKYPRFDYSKETY